MTATGADDGYERGRRARARATYTCVDSGKIWPRMKRSDGRQTGKNRKP
jgi:hypothetical protein